MNKNCLILSIVVLFFNTISSAAIKPVSATEVVVSTGVTFGFYSLLSTGLTYLSMVAANRRYIEFHNTPYLVAGATSLGTLWATISHYNDLSSRTPAQLEARATKIIQRIDPEIMNLLEAQAQDPEQFKAAINQTALGNESFNTLATKLVSITNELCASAEMIHAASTLDTTKQPLARLYKNYYTTAVNYTRWTHAEDIVWTVARKLEELENSTLISTLRSGDSGHPVMAVQRVFASCEQPFMAAFEKLTSILNDLIRYVRSSQNINLQDLTYNGKQNNLRSIDQLERMCCMLDEVLVMIKGDPRYYRELEEKKRAEEEARRIQLERERMRVELELEERRIRAEEERARIERQRACIEAERLRTEQQRLNDERRREEERRQTQERERREQEEHNRPRPAQAPAGAAHRPDELDDVDEDYEYDI